MLFRSREIGIFFLVNTLVVGAAQLPVSRLLEGRRRMRALALMPLLFAVSWLAVDATGYWLEGAAAFAALAAIAVVLGVGECLHGPAHIALVADIGPEYLRGRYFAVHSLSWGLAGAVGPAVGGAILGSQPFLLWPLAAAACVCAAGIAFALDGALPPRLRRIPRAEAEPAVLEPVTTVG